MRLVMLALAISIPVSPVLGQEAEKAEKLYRAMENKILAAESLALEFSAEMKAGGNVHTSKGKINVAAGNKTQWTFESDLAKGVRTLVVTNGEAGYMKVGDKVSVPGPKAPKGSLLLARIARFGAMFAVAERELKPSDPIKDFPVTDFKLGVKEMIDKRESQVVEYQMVQKKDKPTRVRWKTWIDTETNLPLKRSQVAEAQGKRAFQMDETYAVFSVDTKLDEKLFTIPQDSSPPEVKAPATSTEWKVIAQYKFGPVLDGKQEFQFPFLPGPEDKFEAKGGVVFRNAAELAGRMLRDEKKGKDENEQKKAAEWAAKALKVERIDWDKQSLLLIYGGYYRADWNEVDLVSITRKGRVLTVTYDVRLLEKMTGSHAPLALVLVKKIEIEGDILFKAVGRAQEAPEPLMQWKVIASISAGAPMKPDISIGEGSVFRNPEELARAMLDDPKKAKDENEQKKATQWAAEVLKVDRIDWDKQMLLSVDGGTYRGPYYAVNLVSIKRLGGGLTVRFEVVHKKKKDGVSDSKFSHTPRALVLVDRFPGVVRILRVPQNRLPITAIEILEQADTIEVLSLNPRESDKAGFHGFKVLGTVQVKGIRQLDLLLNAINVGTDNYASNAPVAAARNPRYGIRATHEGKTVSLQLCFDSSFIAVNVGKQFDLVPTSNSSQRLLDQLLREAKVPQVLVPVKVWQGKFAEKKDEPLMKEAPKSGYIADAEAWTRLWKAWRFEKEQPAIDFKNHVVLVAVAEGAVNGWKETGLQLRDKDDLRSQERATEIAGPGFIYLIRVVERGGVKTINGTLITSPPKKVGSAAQPAKWVVGAIRRFESPPARVFNAVFSSDGKWAASASEDNTVRLWEVATGKEIRRINTPVGVDDSLAFSPDGSRILHAHAKAGDNRVRAWDVKSGKELMNHKLDEEPVHYLVFLPDGKRALAGHCNRRLHLWDLATGNEIWSSKTHFMNGGVAVSQDGRFAVSASGEDDRLRLWNLETLKAIEEFKAFGGRQLSGSAHGLAFTPDGKYILASSNSGWRLLDAKTGATIREHKVKPWHSRFVILPDSRRVLIGMHPSAKPKGTLILWDVHDDKELHRFEGEGAPKGVFALTPDGRQALCVSDGYLAVINLPLALAPRVEK